MSIITVTTLHDGTQHVFENSNLTASYSVETTPAGDVVVNADLYEGSQLLHSVQVERFSAQDVDGWRQA